MESWIFTTISWALVQNWDPCFRWGDIQLLVTMYIWYYTLNYSQFLTKNFHFFGTPSWKRFYIFSARYLSLKERKRIRAFLWKTEPRRTSALHMIWWHSANRDVHPGRFQPYDPFRILCRIVFLDHLEIRERSWSEFDGSQKHVLSLHFFFSVKVASDSLASAPHQPNCLLNFPHQAHWHLC